MRKRREIKKGHENELFPTKNEINILLMPEV
jgi:hypothetical protein